MPDTTTYRKTTQSDLVAVLYWLKQEYEKEGTETGFWCNKNLIEDGHEQGQLHVFAVLPENKPVAFCLRSGSSIHIFEVKPEDRRKRIGHKMFDHILWQAQEEDLPGLCCECMPRTSISFWEGLGFTRVDSNSRSYKVALPLRRPTAMTQKETPHRIRIQRFHEWEDTALEDVFESDACLHDGRYTLVTEYTAYASPDNRVRIEIDGQEVVFQKLKRTEDFGVEIEQPWVRICELYPEQA